MTARPGPAWAPITVMSANLWHDWPRQHRWAARLEAVARLATEVEADVLLLQEVARTRALRADDWLAQRLDMARAYARANGSARAIGFEEGLAILSRYPMGTVRWHRLSRNPWIRRIALAACLTTPAGPIHAVSVHLGLVPRQNVQHLRTLRTWVSEVSAGQVAVIGGDFNAPPTRHHIGHLRRDWIDAFHHSWPTAASSTHRRPGRLGRKPREQVINYVFLQQPDESGRHGRGWDVLEAAHVDGPAGRHSDHRAVITRIIPRERGDRSSPR